MASPQLEKGHTRIAHEIMAALVRTSLSAAQLRVVFWILRLTYGFQRKEVSTSANAFATSLRTTSKYVIQVLGELERFSVITVEWTSLEKCKLSFNKDFEKWKCFL